MTKAQEKRVLKAMRDIARLNMEKFDLHLYVIEGLAQDLREAKMRKTAETAHRKTGEILSFAGNINKSIIERG